MDEEDVTRRGSSQSNLNSNTITLRTKDVGEELKRWISTDSDVITSKLYDNAIVHIESNYLNRPLSCWETTWTERQYVITLLNLWLIKSLEKAFKYLNNKENDISKYMSTVLSQLNSIHSFEDIRCIQLKDVTSPLESTGSTPLFNWCDEKCQYLQLILGQRDMLTKTPRLAMIINCYFKQFKTSCIENIFTRCVNDIVKDKVKNANFIVDLNDFLTFVNEEKNLLEMMLKQNFRKNYVQDDIKTGLDVVNQLVKMLVTCPTRDFLIYVEKEEKLKSIWDNLKGATENQWQETFHSLVEEISQSFRQTDSSQTTETSIPEWFTRFEKASSLLNEVKWTPKFKDFTKEICKKFLLPETEIQFKEENGKQIISIEGVVIFVSQMIAEMNELKQLHPDVEEIKILALQSAHIDCHLDNGTWHGINIGITTDKLIVDDPVNDESFRWNVSGLKAEDQLNKGKLREPGESGGNIHVVCNQIINGEKWTIVSDGGNGSDSYKWTKEEFEKSFPSFLTDDKGENMKTVLTTLENILPNEKRKKGGNITPEHIKGNFLIEGRTDGSEITATFYKKRKKKESLIFIKRDGHIVGQGGYGGDITVECLSPKGSSSRTEIPFAGTDAKRKPLTNIRMGVYEASGSNGKTGKVTGDVAFIHKVTSKSSKNEMNGDFHGFGEENLRMKFISKAEYDLLNMKEYYDLIAVVKYENIEKVLLREKISTFHARSETKTLVDAVKKNAVIRQNLVQHFDQIDERNQLTESIKKMLSNPTEHHSSSIDEIINEMDNKVHQFHQLTTQRQQNQFEHIQQEQNVRPAINSSSLSFPKPKIIGRRPVWTSRKEHLNKTNVYCLDKLETEDGNDSALHCLFGQINSKGKYACNDTTKFRKRIAQYIREKHGGKKEEDAKLIESPTGKLESDELQILAEILDITIHVYVAHRGSLCFRYQKTIKKLKEGRSGHNYFILDERNGRWQKLEPANKNLELLCQNFTLEDRERISTLSIDENDAVNSCIEKLNTEDKKTRDKLSRLLLARFKNNMDVDETNKLVKAIGSLAEWVDYYNTRDISPFFYLTIVEKCEPQDWVRELILLEMEERIEKPWEDEDESDKWRKVLHKYFKENDRALSLFVKIAMEQKKENDILFSLDLQKLFRILPVLEKGYGEDFITNKDDIGAMNLFYKDRGAFWEGIVDGWSNEGGTERMTDEKRKEYVNSLLEMEYKNEIESTQNLTHDTMRKIKSKCDTILQGQNSTSTESSSTMDEVLDEMIGKTPETETTKKNMMENTKRFVQDLKSNQLKYEQKVESIAIKLKKGEVKLNKEKSLAKFLCVYDYAVQQKMGFSLRNTQRVAIMTLLANGKRLAQVSTGEGKSIIVAGVAIGFALTSPNKNNRQVDVITNNDILAIRDSSLTVAEGGLKELYEFFNVSVANNCSQSVDKRKKAYNMDVVYGQLANFQRDYLLDEIYSRNIRGKRKMDFGIIDEADCMLLDRGSNVLYLSHDIPGMETLESLYVFIWEQICDDTSPDIIKANVLYDLYGQITQEDLNSIYAPLEQEERLNIWEHLIEKEIIDRQGRLLIHDVSKIKEEKISYEPANEALKEKQFNSKIVFFVRKIAKRERRIRIPDHLLDFVDRQLDTWLVNARWALELKQDEDYVIDCDRSDTNPDLNPKVIIIDPETGTDQVNSQWDGALHQFLQLKERCKLTMQSLKAVFISNAKYMNKYQNLVGVSGTLGSEPEQEFLKTKYRCTLFTIPTAVPKRFSLKPPKLLKTKEKWRNAIIEETETIINENRSIVIFCQSIKEVNQVHHKLESTFPRLMDNKRIHRYTRDYEKFEFESKKLDEGHVIVATNLAGRGTDIKLSETLKANGGLHICLTYFPENERVEDQAMGRAARKGQPGSGILILCEEPRTAEECGAEKIFVIKEERAWKERQRISRLKRDFNNIEMLEKLFESANLISKHSINTTFKLIEEQDKNEIVQIVEQLNDDELLTVIHDNLLDKWAMWLDKTDFNFQCYNIKQRQIVIRLYDLIIDIPKCMTPARKVTFAKHLAMEKSNKKAKINPEDKAKAKEKAIDILKSVISSPDYFFYPSAFYYHAFILLTKSDLRKEKFKKKKDEFIRTLRSAATILNEHVDMQIYFILNHQSVKKSDPSFCDVDGYEEQKQNTIKIFEYFLRTIQWMLGSRCSISDLREAGSEPPKVPGTLEKYIKNAMNFYSNKKIKQGSKEHKIPLEKTGDYFLEMIEKNCISCVINDPNTIPSNNIEIEDSTLSIDEQNLQNAGKIVRQISNDYGVNPLVILGGKLDNIFRKARNEEEIEKKLKEEIEIPCTRKAFWKELIDNQALHPSKDWEKMECFIMSEKLLEELNLDKEKQITLEFGFESFDETTNRLNVLYNPTYDSQQELEKAKKVMFSKEHVIEKLLSKEKYREIKKLFESNKIARLDLDKLSQVDLKLFGRICTVDLDRTHITNKSDQDEIWNQLIKQGIIDDRGYLVFGYDLTKDFSYPECPVYAEAVTQLVRKKFVFELVRQQWLKLGQKTKDNPNFLLKAINVLPRKPYRDMLADLMEAHVISGARVTEHSAIDFKEEIDKITEYDQERDSLMEYLASRQSVLTAKPIRPEFVLDFIERDINFASELYIFRLVGFDRVIDIKDRKWTIKRVFLMAPSAILVFAGGLASIGVGGYLTYESFIPFKLSKNLFFMGGVSDILYAVETILSRRDFTWANYGRQRIRSAMGKTEPIDAIKAIWKLSGSSNQSFRDATVTHKHIWNKQTDQNQENSKK